LTKADVLNGVRFTSLAFKWLSQNVRSSTSSH
jgi:hypothetical protein